MSQWWYSHVEVRYLAQFRQYFFTGGLLEVGCVRERGCHLLAYPYILRILHVFEHALTLPS